MLDVVRCVSSLSSWSSCTFNLVQLSRRAICAWAVAWLFAASLCATAAQTLTPITCTVTRADDTGGPSGNPGDLRDCINQINANPVTVNGNAPPNNGANTIDLGGVSGTIKLQSVLPLIQSSVNILGPGARQLTVSGAKAYQVLTINSGAAVYISSLTIANGFAYDSGGGILNNGTLTVTNSTFSGNSATLDGGGISNSGTLTVSNSTFSGNSATGAGGSIFNGGMLKVTNSTLSGNTAGNNGGGIYNTGGKASLANSIVAGNTAAGSADDFDGGSPYTDNGGNFVGYFNGAQVNAGAIDLTPLAYYGGPTQTMIPLPGSPAICAGLAANVPSGVTTDQRGWPIGPSICPSGVVDAGAVQTNYVLVNTLVDGLNNDAASCTDGQGNSCSLRDALMQVGGGQADIGFAPSLFVTGAPAVAAPGTILVGCCFEWDPGATVSDTPLPSITGTVNLIGPGANLLTVSGNSDRNVGTVLTVKSSATANVYGLTIANASSDYAGGILNVGTLTVTNCTVSGNQTFFPPPRSGGYGPGDGPAAGGILNLGTLTVTNSTFSGNQATGFNVAGGGVFSSGTLTVSNSTFSGNFANGAGGSIFNGGMLKVTSSTFSDNSFGDDILNFGTLTLANSIVTWGVAGNGFSDSGPNLIGLPNGVTSVNQILGSLAYSPANAGVQVIMPLPGASGILCQGSASVAAAAGITTDARGFPMDSSCPSGSIDLGAVQSNYTGVQFVQQPGNSMASTTFAPAPSVEVVETNQMTGTTDTVAGIPITLVLDPDNPNSPPSWLSGTNPVTTGPVTAASVTVNEAQFGGLQVSAVGTYTLEVAWPIIGATAVSASFNINGVPTVTGVSPAAGLSPTGTTVTVIGTNFLEATAVSFGGVPAASFTVNGPTSIAAVSPTGEGTVDVTVTTPGGTSATSAADQFTYVVPTTTSLTPSATPSSTFAWNLQPAITVAVNPPTASGITASEVTATLDGSTLLTVTAGAGANVFNIALPAAPLSVGTHTIAFNFTGSLSAGPPLSYYSPSSASIGLTVNPPSFVVNTTQDDTTAPSLQTVQQDCPANPTTSGAGNCTLREALTAAGSVGAGAITFDGTVFASAQTITLGTLGTLNIQPYTSITGPTAGSGATMINLVTVSGNNAYTVFKFAPWPDAIIASIANLNIVNGNSADSIYGGGGIYNNGTLTVTNSTFSGNFAIYFGGAISSDGTLTVTNSTFSGNSAIYFGGAIFGGTLTVTSSTFSGNSATYGGGAISSGMLTVTNSTFSGNSATYDGGAISSGGMLTVTNSTFSGNSATYDGGGGGIRFGSGFASLANSIVAGNTAAGSADDFDGGSPYTDNGGNFVGYFNGAQVNAGAIDLTPLAYYGGPTQTMIPLPGSPAICAGLAANVPSGVTSDQRGLQMNPLCPSGAVDSGAVQTNYSLAFTSQPAPIAPAAVILPNVNFQAAVTLQENGVAFASTVTPPATPPSLNVPLTLTSNPTGATLTGGSATTINGVADYLTLQVSAPGTGDTLTANLTLNGALVPALAISATSMPFQAGQATPTVTWPTASAMTYGQALSASTLSGGSASYNGNNAAGTFAWTTPATTPAAGSQSEGVTFTPADSTDYSSVTGMVSVSVATAPLMAAANDQSMSYGGALPTLTGTLTGEIPGDGITASYTTTATASSPAGTYPITASLNDPNAKLGNYTVTNTSGTLVIQKATPGMALTSSQNPALTQNGVTLTATVSAAVSTPTGSVMFMNGTGALGGAVQLNANGVATLTTNSLPIGNELLTAVYSGDPNFVTATSNAVQETIEDFSLSISNGSTTSETVNPGQSSTFQVTFSPVAPATTFPATINLTATGLPPGATYTFTPSSLLAGSGVTAVTLMIQTAPATAANNEHSGGPAPLALALLALFGMGRIRQRGKHLPRLLCVAILLLGSLAASLLGGCGGRSSENYTITIIATAGNLQHTTIVTLNVQ